MYMLLPGGILSKFMLDEEEDEEEEEEDDDEISSEELSLVWRDLPVSLENRCFLFRACLTLRSFPLKGRIGITRQFACLHNPIVSIF